MPSVSIGKAWSPMLALVPGDILQNQGANPVLVSSAIPPSQNEAVELQPFERIVVQAAVEVRREVAREEGAQLGGVDRAGLVRRGFRGTIAPDTFDAMSTLAPSGLSVWQSQP